MDEDKLLDMLQELESNSAQFVWGTLAQERREAMREYYRQPYGNEEPGWSSIVTSEVQDTVEWILPDLLDMFVSNDEAVVFEPTQAADAKGAEQATDAANYVFYKQNNGFLQLYTAFKDALMVKNCAVHWRKETERFNEKIPVNGASYEMLALLLHDDDNIVSAEQVQQPMMDPATGRPAIGPDGQPMMQTLFNAIISRPSERKVIKIDAFEPDNLLVYRNWTSPLLEKCPYVARNMEVSLSDLKQMGFDDVTAEELAASDQPSFGASLEERNSRRGLTNELIDPTGQVDAEDESLTLGYLRIEWVLVDFDGDGIAERREVYRLADKILSNEECDEVPVATGSPIIVQHRWDGMSVAEIMSDLQMLKTELTRGVVNNAYLANNPRQTVLTDPNGGPFADVDAMLDNRPGVVIPVKRADAIGGDATPFVGNQMFPLLEYVDQMGEKRTGVSKQQQGLDPNALRPDRTAAEVMMTANAAKSRIKLIARILAETVVKPTFRGVLRLLTSGDMQPLAFRLRGEFVELDPNEWHDGYDMTVNVGLGTGDKEKQLAVLGGIFKTQMGFATSPMGEMFVTPEQLFNTQSKMIQLGGFKNVGDFLNDPGPQAKLPSPPPPPPDPSITVAQIRAQAEEQKGQREAHLDAQRVAFDQQLKDRDQQNQLALQSSNDARDAERERMKIESHERIEMQRIAADAAEKQAQRDHDRWKIELDASVRIECANIASKAKIIDPATVTSTNEIATEVRQ